MLGLFLLCTAAPPSVHRCASFCAPLRRLVVDSPWQVVLARMHTAAMAVLTAMMAVSASQPSPLVLHSGLLHRQRIKGSLQRESVLQCAYNLTAALSRSCTKPLLH